MRLFVLLMLVAFGVTAQTIQQTERLRFKEPDTVSNTLKDSHLSLQQTNCSFNQDSLLGIANWFLKDTSDVYAFTEFSLMELEKSSLVHLLERRGGVENIDSIVKSFCGISSIEEWSYSSKHSTIIIKVIAVAPIIKVYDEDGGFKGTGELYWKKLHDMANPYRSNEYIHDGDLIVVKRFRNRLHFSDTTSQDWARDLFNLKVLNDESFAKLVYKSAKDNKIEICDKRGVRIWHTDEVLTPMDTIFFESDNVYKDRMDFTYWFSGLEIVRGFKFEDNGEVSINVISIAPIVDTSPIERKANERYGHPPVEFIPFWYFPKMIKQ